MGAIAVSEADERRIVRLRKKLGMSSKAGVLRVALDELERRIERRERASVIRDYVRKHGSLDRRENRRLSAGGIGREEA
jgi:predicted kinase